MSFWSESDYVCKPLKTLIEVHSFINDPPIWRTLCRPLTPHSTYAIKNCEVDSNFKDVTLERPLTFCHFESDYNADKNRELLHDEKELPKLLVCHDMANGYHDDSNINGTDNHAAYTFYNWAAVDIFCYFSHHLVTVPPLGWINAAHAHGVKVIGTFITEWADGISFWNHMFSDDCEMDNLVSSLVAIAKTLKFEGWLINVENKISEPEKLLKFMDNLHKTLHQEIPGAELIWYDSVTKTGQLSWQNGLNELNRPFFDLCDGIFTNYSWNEVDIVESAKEAGSRLKDVYIGIDVWGRNFYGGGMFNTQEAVKLVHKHGCSLAVFAPAWTHEAMVDDNTADPNAIYMGDCLSKQERFIIRDRALWDSLWPFFKTKLPCTLPFRTSFCRGLGTRRRRYGEVYTNSPWYNLRHMEYQPNCAHGHHGYLLSTDANIKSVSHLAMTTVGILKIRQSFMLSREKMFSDESKMTILDETNQISEEEKAKIDDTKTDEDNKINEETDISKEGTNTINNEIKQAKDDNKIEEVDEDEEERETINRFYAYKSSTTNLQLDESGTDKLKSVMRRIFRLKREHTSTDDEDKSLSKRLPEHTDDSFSFEAGSSSRVFSSGRSMTLGLTVQLVQAKTRYSVAYLDEEKECLQTWLEDSFNGGTCLRINPSDAVTEDHRIIRLFFCDFHINLGEMLVVCVVTKVLPEFRSQTLNLWLHVMTESSMECVELVGEPKDESSEESMASNTKCYPLEITSDEFLQLRTYLVMQQPDFYLVPENPFGWNILYYQVPWQQESRVTSINLRTGMPQGSILLGHVGLCVREGSRSSSEEDGSQETARDSIISND